MWVCSIDVSLRMPSSYTKTVFRHNFKAFTGLCTDFKNVVCVLPYLLLQWSKTEYTWGGKLREASRPSLKEAAVSWCLKTVIQWTLRAMTTLQTLALFSEGFWQLLIIPIISLIRPRPGGTLICSWSAVHFCTTRYPSWTIRRIVLNKYNLKSEKFGLRTEGLLSGLHLVSTC